MRPSSAHNCGPSARPSTSRFARTAAVSGALVALCAGVAACGGTTSSPGAARLGAAKPAPAAVRDGGTVTMALASMPTNWNPLTADGASFDADQITGALFPSVFVDQPDLTVALNTDIMVSAQQTGTAPQTVVYKIRKDAVWSDGTPISAADFVWAWHRLSGHDAKYLVNTSTGYDRIGSVTGSDGGKTVTVVFAKPFADWRELFSSGTPLLPAHYIDSLAKDPHAAFNTGLAAHYPTVVGGPFRVASYTPNVAVTLERNPSWHGARPHLDGVVFREVADTASIPQAMANGEIDVAYPTPQVDLLRSLSATAGVRVELARGMTYEHVDANLASPALHALAVRRAIFTAINRSSIADATVRQLVPGTPLLGSRLLVAGLPGYADSVSSSGLGSGDLGKARQILTAAGYHVVAGKLVDPAGHALPKLRYVYLAGNHLRADAATMAATELKALGLTVVPTPVADFGKAIGTGAFDLIEFSWVSSPFPASTSRDIFVSGGGLNFDHFADPKVDAALNDAVGQLDAGTATADLRTADRLLTADAVTLPLYQTPTVLARSAKLANVVNNPTLAGPAYDIGAWGFTG